MTRFIKSGANKMSIAGDISVGKNIPSNIGVTYLDVHTIFQTPTAIPSVKMNFGTEITHTTTQKYI